MKSKVKRTRERVTNTVNSEHYNHEKINKIETMNR